MNKQKTENQSVEEKEVVVEETTAQTTDAEAGANMADGTEASTDTVAEEPKAEEIDWKDKYIRLQAEFDNFRKRTLREKMALIESGGSDVWKSVLPILDDMERATAASKKSDDIEALRQGEELVLKKFESVLQGANITPIDCIDKPFNEEEQEAVARFAAGEEKHGLVIDCVQRGYKIGEHVLRYAKVVVGE